MSGKVFYHLLSNEGDVTDIVGDRIYPGEADQAARGDYIVFKKIDAIPNDVKGRTSPVDDERWQVDGYCQDDDDRDNLEVAIRKALDYKGGTINGVKVERIRFKNGNGDFDDDGQKFRTSQDFNLRKDRS